MNEFIEEKSQVKSSFHQFQDETDKVFVIDCNQLINHELEYLVQINYYNQNKTKDYGLAQKSHNCKHLHFHNVINMKRLLTT